ncbi:hypothetical protein CCAND93_100001 [Capnocytophaga canis]|uniref:Uncharacterized protein n=1 Tax=Capnocytophaga canis TaxID=1848903 RepID=A0A0B7IE62_9FLAO|nr:hypothetical protein CCAND93_100001 [Capnocytophaga canis]
MMDTTYWGRNFGVTLFKDAITKENLLKYYKFFAKCPLSIH